MAEEKTFKVANTEITIGNRYSIIGKADMDAPKGFVEHETTKYLFSGNGEIKSVPYDEDMGCYDTGFDEDSLCNAGVEPSLVKSYVTNIQKPFENRFKKKLDSLNDDFWGEAGEQGFSINLYKDREFDTKNVRDRLELFMALKHGFISEKGEKDHRYQKAKYHIVDNNKKQTLKERRAKAKTQAYITLGDLIKDIDTSDTLYTILEWIGFPNPRGVDQNNLQTSVGMFFDNPTTGQVNCEKFNEAFDYIDDPERKTEMEYFSALTKLHHQGRLERRKSQWYVGKTLLGNTLKAGALGATKKTKESEEIRKAIEDELETLE